MVRLKRVPLAMPICWSKCQHHVGDTFAHVHACACVYVSVCPSVRAHEPVCAHPELVWARTAVWVGVRGRADIGVSVVWRESRATVLLEGPEGCPFFRDPSFSRL